jgi:RNA polymerase sigma factor (sigma-70 family)
MATEDICRQLRSEGHPLSFAEVEERVYALRQCLSARQLWLLSSAHPVVESLDNGSAETTSAVQELVDRSPDPEMLIYFREIQDAVSRALRKLNNGERLLIRLRFYEGLSLEQVACLVGLKDAQTTDRRIREVIEKLRLRLGNTLPLHGKTKIASV